MSAPALSIATTVASIHHNLGRIVCYLFASKSVLNSDSLTFLSSEISVSVYSRTPLIRINWDGELSGYAENPDKWIFLGKQATLAV